MASPESPGGSGGNGGNGHKKPGLKLRLPQQLAGGVYANSLVVHHSPDEFVMDFALVAGGGGQIVARVITSPAHMKRVLAALQDNVRKYESLYGPIQPATTGE
jgi:Protein of unknown function (DUF3467)